MFNGMVIKNAIRIEFFVGLKNKIALHINTTIPQLI